MQLPLTSYSERNNISELITCKNCGRAARARAAHTPEAMRMVFFDSTYFLAYALFLIGASLYLRRSRTAIAHWIMVSGVVLDFFATVIPSHGFKSLAIGIGSSATIIAAIILGVVVWCLFLGAVFLRLAERHELSCVLVTIISIAWFIDLVLFLNGVYRA